MESDMKRLVVIGKVLLLILMTVVTSGLLQSCAQTPTRVGNEATSSAANASKRVALVIGNNHYPARFKLDKPVNDATDISNKLISLGFDAHRKVDLTKSEMEEAITEFSQRAKNANVALLYFAGHGFQINQENVLVPIDYHFKEDRGGISANFIKEKMQNATDGTKLFVLDACRTFLTDTEPVQQSSVSSRRTRKLNKSKQIKDVGEKAGLAPMPKLSKFIIMLSTAPGEVAADGDENSRNSPYAAALLQHIDEPIPIETLFTRVTTTVKQNSSNTPPQSPENFTVGLGGNFCFVDCGLPMRNVCHLNIGDGVYEGECENGKANGLGVQRYADGEYYSGSFKDNLRDGRGTQYLIDATEISGTWKAGRLVSGD